MSQVYLEINAQVTPVTPWSDVLIATLGDAGFESFVTTETGFLAYIAATDYDRDKTEGLLDRYQDQCQVSFTVTEIAPTNWNADCE